MHQKLRFHASKQPTVNASEGSPFFISPSAPNDQSIQKTLYDFENTSNSEEQTFILPENCGTMEKERRRIRYIDMEKLLVKAEALDFSTDSDDEA